MSLEVFLPLQFFERVLEIYALAVVFRLSAPLMKNGKRLRKLPDGRD